MKRYLRAECTNSVYAPSLAFVPEGCGVLPERDDDKRGKKIQVPAGLIVTVADEDQCASLIKRNDRGKVKWTDVTELVELPKDSQFHETPAPRGVDSEDVSDEPESEEEVEIGEDVAEIAGDFASDLIEYGFDSAQSIVDADVDALTRVKGIGKVKAEAIQEAALEYLAANEDANEDE